MTSDRSVVRVYDGLQFSVKFYFKFSAQKGVMMSPEGDEPKCENRAEVGKLERGDEIRLMAVLGIAAEMRKVISAYKDIDDCFFVENLFEGKEDRIPTRALLTGLLRLILVAETKCPGFIDYYHSRGAADFDGKK